MEYAGNMIEEHAEIAFNQRMNSNIWLMGLMSPGIAREARPGQFVMIRVRSGMDPLLRRPFSVCAVRDDLFLVLYRVIGQGTSIMAEELRERDRLPVLGPLGRGFELPRERKNILLVGGGIGVAPLVFLAETTKDRDLCFMMGFGSASGIITTEKVLSASVPIAISTDDGTAGHHGPVTDLLEQYVNQQGAQTGSVGVFACGPKPMLKKVAAMTTSLRVPCQVSLEASMACGLGACQGCAVKAAKEEERSYYHVCRDGPVFQAQAIDWDGF